MLKCNNGCVEITPCPLVAEQLHEKGAHVEGNRGNKGTRFWQCLESHSLIQNIFALASAVPCEQYRR